MIHAESIPSAPLRIRGPRVRNRVTKALGLALALALPPALADEAPDEPRRTLPVRLSLEEAVVRALENNPAVRAERLNAVVAGTFEERERAVFDPRFFAEISHSRDRSEQVSRATGERFPVEGEETRGQAGVAARLPTGTDVEIGVSHFQTESNRTPEQQAARVGLSLTQALLQGRGLEANLVGLRQARLDTLASEYEFRGFSEAFVAEVEEAYWDLLLAQQEEDIFERSLEVAQRQLDVTGQRIEVGQISRIELPAAEAEVALRQQALIDARSRRERLRLRLVSLMTPAANPGGWESDLVAADSPTLPDWEIGEVGEHVALARRWRPELEEARLRVERQELAIVQTRNGALPRLDLFIDLGKTGYSQSFRGSYRRLGDDAYDATAGIRFERAWGNREGKSAARRARFVREQAEEALLNLETLVELDVRHALVEVERSTRQVEAGAAIRRLQEEVLRAEQEKFDVGRSTLLQVAQAQRDLLSSQIAEVEALVDVRKALIELHRLDGTLLRRRGIEL